MRIDAEVEMWVRGSLNAGLVLWKQGWRMRGWRSLDAEVDARMGNYRCGGRGRRDGGLTRAWALLDARVVLGGGWRKREIKTEKEICRWEESRGKG